jgi:hypothetical protein
MCIYNFIHIRLIRHIRHIRLFVHGGIQASSDHLPAAPSWLHLYMPAALRPRHVTHVTRGENGQLPASNGLRPHVPSSQAISSR